MMLMLFLRQLHVPSLQCDRIKGFTCVFIFNVVAFLKLTFFNRYGNIAWHQWQLSRLQRIGFAACLEFSLVITHALL